MVLNFFCLVDGGGGGVRGNLFLKFVDEVRF